MINLGCLLARLKISRILINIGNIDQTVSVWVCYKVQYACFFLEWSFSGTTIWGYCLHIFAQELHFRITSLKVVLMKNKCNKLLCSCKGWWEITSTVSLTPSEALHYGIPNTTLPVYFFSCSTLLFLSGVYYLLQTLTLCMCIIHCWIRQIQQKVDNTLNSRHNKVHRIVTLTIYNAH